MKFIVQYKAPERRLSGRFDRMGPIVVLSRSNDADDDLNWTGRHCYARMHDYSADGICFESDFKFQEGSSISFRVVSFKDRTFKVKTGGEYTGEIIWCKKLSSTHVFSYRIGLKYFDFPLTGEAFGFHSYIENNTFMD